MADSQNLLEPGTMTQHSDAIASGPIKGGLLPLMRINGTLYVMPNTLHFYRLEVTPKRANKGTDGGDNAEEN